MLERQQERVLFTGWFTSTLGFLPNLHAVLLSNSLTLRVDTVRFAIEILATFASWLVLRRIHRGRLADGGYGYGKYERLISLAVAAALAVACAVFVQNAIGRIVEPLAPRGTGLGLVFIAVSLSFNAALYLRNRDLAARSGSPIMEAQGRLYLVKTMANLIVLLPLGAAHLLPGSPRWVALLDPVASLLLAAFILSRLRRLVAESLHDLLDKDPGAPLRDRISGVLARHRRLYLAHLGSRSRRSGHRIFVEVFLQFAGSLSWQTVNRRIGRLTAALEQAVPGASVLVVPGSCPVLPRDGAG